MCTCRSHARSKRSRPIAVRNTPHRYGNSHAIQDHTVLPATRQSWHSRPYPSRSWDSIKRAWRDARLSWVSVCGLIVMYVRAQHDSELKLRDQVSLTDQDKATDSHYWQSTRQMTDKAHASTNRIARYTCIVSSVPSRGVVGRGRVPHSPLFGLKFVQKLAHCCNWLLTETHCKIISVQQN